MKYRSQSTANGNACGLSGVPRLAASGIQIGAARLSVPKGTSVLTRRALPQLADDVGVSLRERAAVAGRRSDERLRIVGASLRIFDDAVLHAVDAVTGRDGRRRRRGELARRDGFDAAFISIEPQSDCIISFVQLMAGAAAAMPL